MIDLDGTVLASVATIWGELVDFLPAAGPPQFGLPAVFTERFQEQKFVDGDSVSDEKPVLGIRAAAFLQDPVQNDQFRFRNRLWRIVEPQPDGEGWIHCHLALANDSQAAIPMGAPAPIPTTLP